MVKLFPKECLKFGDESLVELNDFEVRLIKEIYGKYNKENEEKGIFGKVATIFSDTILGKRDAINWLQEEINDIEQTIKFLDFHYKQATSIPVGGAADKFLRYLFNLSPKTGPTYGSFETVISDALNTKDRFNQKISFLKKHLDSSSELVKELEKLMKEFKLIIDQIISFERSRKSIPELN